MVGCQGVFFEEENLALIAAEARTPPPVGSGQRLSGDGYTLLGALPNSAAPQLADRAVAAKRQQLLNAGAAQQSSGGEAAAYDAALDRAAQVREDQRRAVDEALADAGADAPARSPEEILLEIEGQ